MKKRITINITPDIEIRLKRLREYYPNIMLSGIYNKALITGLEFIEKELRSRESWSISYALHFSVHYTLCMLYAKDWGMQKPTRWITGRCYLKTTTMKAIKSIYRKICYNLQRRFDTIVIRAYKYVKRKQDFLYSAKAVHVKKGKRKYTLLFMNTYI